MRIVFLGFVSAALFLAQSATARSETPLALKPMYSVDASCVANGGIGISADGKTLMCFDSWKANLIALDGQRSSLKPEPRRLHNMEKILRGIHVEKNIWLISAASFRLQFDGLWTQFILFDFDAGKSVAEWTGHKDVALQLAYSRLKGAFISAASLDDLTICFWDHKTYKKTLELNLNDELNIPVLPISNPDHASVAYMDLDPTGRYLAVAMRNHIFVIRDLKDDKWKWVTNENTTRKTHRQKLVRFLSSDLVIMSLWSWSKNDLVEIYNWRSGKLLKTIELEKGRVLCDVKVTPDGKLFAIGARGKGYHVSLWDAKSFKQLAEFKAEATSDLGFAPEAKMTFTPDGKQLITSGADCIIRAWDVEAILKK